ncbi:MAG: VWA domain-containing protein, partial [Lachnospiraceae bacterium]|nr:VWA domain-containing protein [Lachnospiraceae bacterium]
FESVIIDDEEAEKRVDEVKQIDLILEDFETEYQKTEQIDLNNLSQYLDTVEQYLYENSPEDMKYCIRSEKLISIYLQSGGVYIYQPELEGIKSVGNPQTMDVATYQPYRSDYDKSWKKYLSYPDDAAAMIDKEFSMYRFQNDGSEQDHNYDDEEVSLENILRFSENNIIIWDGHGGYTEEDGCFVGTGVQITVATEKKYARDIEERTLLWGDKGTYLITPAFIEKYFAEDSLKNSILYLGVCSGAEDDSLVNALLAKGAIAVFAHDGSVNAKYDFNMMQTIFKRAVQKNGSRYYTLDDSLDYAKGQHGNQDGNGTETHLFYQEGYHDIALDWYEEYQVAERDVVLVLDRSGSMDGYPLDQTKEAAIKFVDTVLEQDSRISLVTYDEEISVNSSFTRNADFLKEKITEIFTGGSTNIYDALVTADQLLQSSRAAKKILVLMTDGLPNVGMEENGSFEDALITYAEDIKKQGYYLYTLGFFSAVSEEERLGAQNMLEKMASPGYHYEVESAEDLVFFFDDIASQITGKQYVYIRIACPVDVKVKSQGEILSSEQGEESTRTSFGSLTYEETEEGDAAKILRLDMEKEYDIHIKGYDTGEMTYSVSYPNGAGEYQDVREFPGISVSDGMRAISSTEVSDTSYLMVDSDGDGKYETTYETESNGVMKEKKDHKILYLCIGIGAGVILLITVLIVVIVKSVKKRKWKQESDIFSFPSFSNDIPLGDLVPEAKLERPSSLAAPSQAIVTLEVSNVAGQVEGLFGSYQGKKYPLTMGILCKIGRDASCEIQLTHQQVSRIHCTVQMMPSGKYQVMDCSSNGTYYNNVALEKGKTYLLPKGAIIVLGDPDNVLRLN